MGVYIPNMEKPKGCWDCFNWDCDHWAEHGYNPTDCPLIELEEWNSYSNGKMYALKGTFQKILDDESNTDLELLKDRIEETTWYHIHNGKLVEGANGEEDEPLYKAKDILGILEEFVPEEE
jgi:hypothetical protein